MKQMLACGLFVLGLPLLALGVSEAKLAETKRACFKESSNGYLGARAGGISWDKLKTIARRVASPLEMQEAFASDADFSRLLQSYILVGTSQSSVKAAVTPAYPRKVFFEDGMIIAFAGHPGEAYRKLTQIAEVIYLDCEAQPCGFRFKELDFNQKPVAIDENPTKCAGCHGGRPNWAAYDVWPGVFQQNADFSKRFAQSAGLAPYRSLGQNSIGYMNNRWTANGVSPIEGREPFYFGAYLHALNTTRVHSELVRAKQWQRSKYAILASLLQCANLSQFRPRPGDTVAARDAKWEAIRQIVKKSLLDRTVIKRENFQKGKSIYGGTDYFQTKEAAAAGYYSEAYREPVAAIGLKYYLEPDGLDIDSFSFDFEPMDFSGSYGYFAGVYLDLTQVACTLLPEAVKQDPTAEGLLRHPLTFGNTKLCRELQEWDRRVALERSVIAAP